MHFINDIGMVPNHMVTDGAKELTQGLWKDTIQKYKIIQTMTEAHSQWQNRAESEIRELKRMLKRFTRTSGSPQRLWCYLLDFICKIRRLMVPWDAPNARPPSELRLRTTPDISEAAQFDWYQYVWFVNPKREKCIARYIGVADEIGAMMTFWLLPK